MPTSELQDVILIHGSECAYNSRMAMGTTRVDEGPRGQPVVDAEQLRPTGKRNKSSRTCEQTDLSPPTPSQDFAAQTGPQNSLLYAPPDGHS